MIKVCYKNVANCRKLMLALRVFTCSRRLAFFAAAKKRKNSTLILSISAFRLCQFHFWDNILGQFLYFGFGHFKGFCNKLDGCSIGKEVSGGFHGLLGGTLGDTLRNTLGDTLRDTLGISFLVSFLPQVFLEAFLVKFFQNHPNHLLPQAKACSLSFYLLAKTRIFCRQKNEKTPFIFM